MRLLLAILIFIQSASLCPGCSSCSNSVCSGCSNSSQSIACTCIQNCQKCTKPFICMACDNGYTLDSQNKTCTSSATADQPSSYVVSMIIGISFLSLICCCIVTVVVCMCRKRFNGNQIDLLNQSQSVEHIEFVSARKIDYEKEKDCCSICLEESSCDVVTQCKHYFHLKCLVRWFHDKSLKSCPNCIKPDVFVKRKCKKCQYFTQNVEYCSSYCKKEDHLKCLMGKLGDCTICCQVDTKS